jgi:imidazolonepropionase-like amidohydrolase
VALRLSAALAVLVLAGCRGDDADLLIRADRLFDGERIVEPGALLVRGDKIVAVGRDVDGDVARRIDLGDATILPGFIDLHVHTEFRMLRGGVTTVRNVGGPRPALRPAGRFRGLRVLSAGPLVSVVGGYPSTVWDPIIALNVRGPADARRAVRDLARRGAAVIKISLEPGGGRWPMLSVTDVRAIVAEAHAHDLEVTAHAMGPAGVSRALAGGVDELAHTPCGASEEMLRELVRRKVEIVSTLHVIQVNRGGCLYAARRFVELGGTLLYGSDVGNNGIPFGIDVDELRLMEAAGLSPEMVLAAATAGAGEQLGLAPLGRLVANAPADLIAVAGDARKLRDSLARPLLVVSGGRLIVGRTR